jgi:hypothetical protein
MEVPPMRGGKRLQPGGITKKVIPGQEEPPSGFQKLTSAGNILGEASIVRIPDRPLQRGVREQVSSATGKWRVPENHVKPFASGDRGIIDITHDTVDALCHTVACGIAVHVVHGGRADIDGGDSNLWP